MSEPILPDYGHGTLSDVLPAVAARLGVAGASDMLGLPDSSHYVLLLVDGLGSQQVRDWGLAPSFVTERCLKVGAPSTTATSLVSLGTGLVPGAHGVAGYSFKQPGFGVLTPLRWPRSLSALDVQPQLTYLERMKKAQVGTFTLMPPEFDRSGLSAAAWRGADFWALPENGGATRTVEQVVLTTQSAPITFTYLYEGALDHAGHAYGVGSQPWELALLSVVDLVNRLRAALAADVCLIVTGDHGMVNIPKRNQIVLEDSATLQTDLTLIAGEGRLRYLYTNYPDRVAASWQKELGERAWVRTKEQTFAEGWFGEVNPKVADRFGDVVVAMRADYAVMTNKLWWERDLVGMHGSLTPAEVEVPWLVF